MLLDQETLRFIFGLKLRSFREARGLSLNQLSQLSNVSPSYLNEIEKGKKYPKADKIAVLATGLGVPYDELISVKLSEELELLTKVLETNLLKGMPFEVFGVSAQNLFELLANRPQEVRAFIGTVLELVRNHHLSVEEFFHAALRAYLDLNENHFPDIEAAASEFREENPLENLGGNEMIELLSTRYGIEVREVSFGKFPKEVQRLFSIFLKEPHPTLLLNPAINDREKRFILTRELGFAYLKIKERPAASSSSVDSFEVLLNNLKGAYFASAVLIPEKAFINEIRAFFHKTDWNPEEFKRWVLKYPGTIESFFHRFSQVLPHHFGMSNLFYLRVRMNSKNKRFALSRELHLSSAHGPHGALESEHYCRRWITTQLLEKSIYDTRFPLVAAQRSRFFESNNSYLNLCMVNELSAVEDRHVASTIGIHLNPAVEKKIRFLGDPAIAARDVADTCERCSLTDCEERSAPARLYEQSEKQRKSQTALQGVIDQLSSTRH